MILEGADGESMRASLPADEARRLEELHRLGVLGGARIEALTEYCVAASALFECPMAFVTLIDEHRQWLAGKVGIDLDETSRDHAFCAHAILKPDETLVVEDATNDPRFSANPLVVQEPRIRWYVGAPLRMPSGRALGTLCVLDTVARPRPSERALEALEALARRVVDALWTVRRSEALTRAHEGRKGAEREQRASADRARGVMEHLESGLLLVDEEDRVVLANRAFCGMFGIEEPPVVLEGTSARALEGRVVGRMKKPESFLVARGSSRGPTPPPRNEFVELKDGRALLRNYAPVPRRGAIDHLWVFRDFSKTLQTQRQLVTVTGPVFLSGPDGSDRAMAETLRELFAADGVLMTEVRDDEIVQARVWAGPAMGIEGKVRPLDESLTGRVFREGAFVGAIGVKQVRFHSEMGMAIYASAAAAPIWNRHGRPHGAIVLYFQRRVEDDPFLLHILEMFALRISSERERQLYQQDLVRARDEAEAGLRAKSEFLATMSHEVRTPLNGVLGFAELLAHTDLDDEQRECVATIRASGGALLGLFDDIFDLVTLQAESVELASQIVDPSPALEALVAECKSKCPPGVELILERESPPSAVRADVASLRKVVGHLLDNALKFTSEGRITLRLTTGPGETWRAVVSDTGIGIPTHELERVFEAFAQVDGTSTRRFEGTGMGLTLVRKVVEAMGGKVWAQSALGQGSSFWVELPSHLPEV